MTPEEIAVAALARVAEFADNYPTTRTVIYRRIGARQAQLFSQAAEIEPWYFATVATGELLVGASPGLEIDLASLSPTPELIVLLEISDAGTSSYSSGDRVHVVELDDPEAEIPPRVTLRGQKIQEVGGDLAGVTSLDVHYSRQPLAITTGSSTVELPEQFHELLVVDAAKMTIKKVLDLDKDRKDEVLSLLEDEEEELVGDFARHLRHYAWGGSSRFGQAAVDRMR